MRGAKVGARKGPIARARSVTSVDCQEKELTASKSFQNCSHSEVLLVYQWSWRGTYIAFVIISHSIVSRRAPCNRITRKQQKTLVQHVPFACLANIASFLREYCRPALFDPGLGT
jgi:hypothetical protein